MEYLCTIRFLKGRNMAHVSLSCISHHSGQWDDLEEDSHIQWSLGHCHCGVPYWSWIVYFCTSWSRERKVNFYSLKVVVIWGFSVTQSWIIFSHKIIRSCSKKDDFLISFLVQGKPRPEIMILHLSFTMFICPES